MADTKKAKKDDVKAEAKAPELKAVEREPPTDAGDSGADSGAPLPRRKLVMFGALPFLVVLTGLVIAYYGGLLGKFSHHKLDCTTITEGDKDYGACAQEIAKASNAALPPGVFVDIPDMIVNLNSSAKQTKLLKISLKVELESKDDQKSFEAIMPRIVDQFQTYLRELRLEDLRGSSGMYRMKIELLSRVRAAAPEVKVRDVLFQEILVE
jgi:flagellar FliL protein